MNGRIVGSLPGVVGFELSVPKVVSSRNGVVWLDDSGGDLGSWVDSWLLFRFLAVVYWKPFHQQRSETGTGITRRSWFCREELKKLVVLGDIFSVWLILKNYLFGCRKDWIFPSKGVWVTNELYFRLMNYILDWLCMICFLLISSYWAYLLYFL